MGGDLKLAQNGSVVFDASFLVDYYKRDVGVFNSNVAFAGSCFISEEEQVIMRGVLEILPVVASLKVRRSVQGTL